MVVLFGLVVAPGVVVVVGEVAVLGVLMVGDVPTGGHGTVVVAVGPASVVVVPGVMGVVPELVEEVDDDPVPT